MAATDNAYNYLQLSKFTCRYKPQAVCQIFSALDKLQLTIDVTHNWGVSYWSHNHSSPRFVENANALHRMPQFLENQRNSYDIICGLEL